jgi:hypothetical protein
MKTTLAIFLSAFVILPGINRSVQKDVLTATNYEFLNFPIFCQQYGYSTAAINYLQNDTDLFIFKNMTTPDLLLPSSGFYSETELENSSIIEDWMTNPETWTTGTGWQGTSPDSMPAPHLLPMNFFIDLMIDFEEDCVIEPWMTDPYSWSSDQKSL